MELLRVRASHVKNCKDNFTIDMVAKSKKTSEDKEYELQEIADGLFVYNTMDFVGKNASGKTTAIELLDCCYSIIGEFRLENKHYDYENIELEMNQILNCLFNVFENTSRQKGLIRKTSRIWQIC